MTDRTTRPLTTGDVARLVEGRLDGSGAQPVHRVAPLKDAGPSEMGLLADRRYLGQLPDSGAGSLLVAASLADRLADDARPRVVVSDAHAALVPLLEALHPAATPEPAVHPTALLGRGVRLGDRVTVGPFAVLEADVEIGDGVHVGAHCVLGEGTRVGAGSRLYPQVVLYAGTTVGRDVILHSGVRLGVDGFGYAWTADGHRKVPQVGGCVVGDGVEIGANTCIDRGSLGDTVVEEGVKLDNLIHLAHNVRIGAHSAAAALVGIAGSTQVGRGVFFGGQSGVIGHLDLGDGARIAAAAAVLKSVPAGETWSGVPARENREYLRGQAQLGRLPKLRQRLSELEAEVAKLRAALGEEDGAS
jgi:UDP-3-O-[3-hydroxymyristoyl] glucosamine N-acyltransferase